MRIKVLIFASVISLSGWAQSLNDDPCNAIPLSVTSTCNQTTSSNYGATASSGVPAPGCGSYSGGDVWFSATVPASGTFTFTTYGTALSNLAIATYTGNCSSLTLVSCKYNGSGVANMPSMTITGTPGVVYYFRAWNPGNTTVGYFDVCATASSPTPLPPNNQDCLDAIPICQSSFSTTASYSGTGNIGNEINTSNTCLSSGEKNDVWYQFTVQNSGSLCFCIDPLNNSNDYDWALFNLTNNNCSDIASLGSSLYGACNYSGTTGWYNGGTAPSWVLSGATDGCTGLFPTSPNNTESQNGPCISVTTGQSFVLNISNFSSSQNGYNLYFPPPGTSGMAVIYDNVPPVMQSLPVNPSCGGDQLFVKFSENVQCSTVQTGDFTVTGPDGSHTISSVSGSACLAGGTYENQFLVSFSPALTTPGTYTVCLTNSAGSVADACNNLAAPVCYTFSITGPNISVTPTNPNCSTGTGTVVVAGSATTGPYNYSINGGTYQSSGTFTGLAAGTYTMAVIDNSSGCQNKTTTTITIPTAISTTLTPTNATCANNDGSITSSVSGGTPGYTYTWSPTGGSSANASSLSPGTYTLTVKDSKACTHTATATISQTGTVTANFSAPTAQCLTGNSYTFTNTGTSGATYSWNFGDAGTGTGSPVTHTYASSGAFTVTETVTLGVCVATHTVAITVNPMPTVTVASHTICPGASTSFTASGANTYTWSPATGLSATTGSAVTASPSSTTPYTVTGTSASGCTATATATITVNPTPTVTVNSATMCPGATSTLTASGASTYTWSPSTTLSASTGSVVTATPSVTTNYTINATSAAGCTTTATSTVTIGGSIVASVNSATICAGNSATLNATGGTTYTWTPGTGLSSTTGATVTANPAATTTYTITAASGGCTGTTTAMVTVNPLPTVTVNSPSICIGSSTTLNASGASTYSWSPGTGLSATSGASVTANPTVTTTYTVTGTSAASCTATAISTVTVNPLPTLSVTSGFVCNGNSATLTASGASTYTWSPATGLSGTTGSSVTASPPSTTHYTVTATNANGCVNSDTTTVTVVNNPTVSVLPATICIGSSATLTASGASTYVWSPGTGLSGTSGTSVVANPTSTTVYTITGTAGTCTAVTTTTVNVNPLPTVTVNSTTICVGQQTATLTAGGASTYTWNPATNLSSSTGQSVTATPTITSSYTVTATDANGCVNSNSATVTVNSLPVITANNGFVCNGGSMTLTASGANTYTWSPATGLSGTTGASVTASPASTTQYTITATDINGCVNSDTTTVSVISNPTVTVLPATICTGNSTTLSATGASTYVWSPGTGLSSTSGTSVTANPTTTTIYTITGTAGTCTAVTTTTVNVNPLPTVVVGSNGPRCVNDSLNLTASGGVSYSWTGPNGFTSSNQNPIITSVTQPATGVYSVTVTDANTCVNSGTVSVVVNPLPTVIATGATVCVGFTINLATNNSGVQYAWTGPNGFVSNQQNPSIPNSTTNMSGTYFVIVKDANGCYNSNGANVLVNPGLTLTAGGDPAVCENGTLHLTADNGVSWSWSGPAGFTSTVQNPVIGFVQLSASGTYTVVGTDANGCQGTSSFNVTINPLPTISANADTICVSQQTAVLTATGANTYTWAPASSLNTSTGATVNADPSVTTTYTIVATDLNGCVNVGMTTVMVNSLPTVTATSGVICIGDSVSLTASGASTYTWSPNAGLSAATGNTVSASPVNTTTFTVTGTDVNGCYNSGTCSVLVNPLPVVTVNSGAICIGKSITLTANGADTYAWTPASGLSGTSGASVNANPTVTSSYTVTGTDANGCKDTAVALVTVNPLPVPVVSPKLSSDCAPVCVTLSYSASVIGTVSWTMGDGTTFNSNSVFHCYGVQGTYEAVLKFTDANGCVGSDSAKIIVYPVPQADFNYSPEPTTIFDPTISFTDATSGAVISTWNWTMGDPTNATAATQNTSFTYLEPGSYPVTLAVSSDHGCTDTVTKIVVIAEDFMIYVPNAFSPNGDGVNDSFGAKGEGIKSFKMYIFDRWGNQVFYSENIDKWWDGTMQSKGNEIVLQDVFVWKIELKTFKNESRIMKGTVTLIK